jgi:hypothetical protein
MWCIPIIPALGKLRRGDHELKANMSFIVRPCLKKKKKFSIVHSSSGVGQNVLRAQVDYYSREW